MAKERLLFFGNRPHPKGKSSFILGCQIPPGGGGGVQICFFSLNKIYVIIDIHAKKKPLKKT